MIRWFHPIFQVRTWCKSLTVGHWGVSWEGMKPKTKDISLDFKKKIIEAYKVGEGNTKLYKHFPVSTAGVRSKIQKFKDSHTVQSKPGWGRKRKISKTLETKLVKDVSKDLRTWFGHISNHCLQKHIHYSSAQELIASLQTKKNSARESIFEPDLKPAKLTHTWRLGSGAQIVLILLLFVFLCNI